MNNDVIKIQRFIRPSDFRFRYDYESDDKFFDHDNLYGITLLFEIDYKGGVVKAKHSVCNGDNFSREIGISYAEINHTECYFPVEMIVNEGNTTEAYLEFLQAAYSFYVNTGCFEDVLSLFRYVGQFQGRR